MEALSLEDSPSCVVVLPLSEAVISLTVVSVPVAVTDASLGSCAQTFPTSEEELSVVTLE